MTFDLLAILHSVSLVVGAGLAYAHGADPWVSFCAGGLVVSGVLGLSELWRHALYWDAARRAFYLEVDQMQRVMVWHICQAVRTAALTARKRGHLTQTVSPEEFAEIALRQIQTGETTDAEGTRRPH